MNKLNKTAYMFFLWAAFCLCGCAGKDKAQMYLEAKVQEHPVLQNGQDLPDAGKDLPDTGSGFPDAGKAGADGPLGSGGKAAGDTGAQDGTCFVYVCGAVKKPGVYELPQGSRVFEAIALAGGLCEDAYGKGINQAKQLADGDMIEILTLKEYRQLGKAKQEAVESQPGAGTPQQETGTPQQAASGEPAGDGRIDLNTATAAQLMELNGIGEAKAANIIAYRESNGRFSSPEEIMNVSGIGEGVYARIQDKIKVAS